MCEFVDGADRCGTPREVATTVRLRRAPAAPFLPLELHGRPVCMISILALAEGGQAERLLAPIRTFGRLLLDLVKRRPYTGLQSMFDTTVPAGWHYYWKSAGLRDLDDDVIDTIVEHSARTQSPRSYTITFHLGGAVADVDPGATAYARRHVAHEINVNAVWLPHQPIGEAESGWAREFASALEPAADGVYVNFLDRDDTDREPDAFGDAAYARLLDLRRRYDPDGFFQGA